MTPPPAVRIRCLGPPTVSVGGATAPPDVLWRKHLALMVYLALSPGGTRSRDHLLGLLWPEKDERRARHSLNEAVRRLRQGLGAGRLITTTDTVALDATDLAVDVLEDGPGGVGQFLEGFSLPDAPEFERWVEAERARHAARVVARPLSPPLRAVI